MKIHENKFLERISRSFNEFILSKKVTYNGKDFFTYNPKTDSFEVIRPYTNGQTKLRDSQGNLCYISTLQFLVNNPGPYNLKQLVQLMYDKEIHKYYGWTHGFWNRETITLYFDLLKENGEPLHETYIRDNHTPFYKAIRSAYKHEKQRYKKFLLEMGEDPEEISRRKDIDFFLQQGMDAEYKIVKLLQDIQAPFLYFQRFSKIQPDLYRRDTNEAIDIKRSIKTAIKKETEIYTKYFDTVTVIYLLGSRQIEDQHSHVRRLSIFPWIQEQDFFQKLSDYEKFQTLQALEEIAESVSEKNAEADRLDSYRNLVNQIIELDQQGYNNKEIEGSLGISYKYVNMILNGKALKEYSGSYSDVYKLKMKVKEDAREETKVLVKQYKSRDNLSSKEISALLNISVDMVNFHLRNANLDSKTIREKRNNNIIDLLNQNTSHSTLTNKLNWILNELKNEYPELRLSTLKNFYYSRYVKKI